MSGQERTDRASGIASNVVPGREFECAESNHERGTERGCESGESATSRAVVDHRNVMRRDVFAPDFRDAIEELRLKVIRRASAWERSKDPPELFRAQFVAAEKIAHATVLTSDSR